MCTIIFLSPLYSAARSAAGKIWILDMQNTWICLKITQKFLSGPAGWLKWLINKIIVHNYFFWSGWLGGNGRKWLINPKGFVTGCIDQVVILNTLAASGIPKAPPQKHKENQWFLKVPRGSLCACVECMILLQNWWKSLSNSAWYGINRRCMESSNDKQVPPDFCKYKS